MTNTNSALMTAIEILTLAIDNEDIEFSNKRLTETLMQVSDLMDEYPEKKNAFRTTIEVITSVLDESDVMVANAEMINAVETLSEMTGKCFTPVKVKAPAPAPVKARKEKSEEDKDITSEILVLLITDATATNGIATIAEMKKVNDKLAKYSNQKLSAVLKRMIEDDIVVKTVNKRKTYFSLVPYVPSKNNY